MFTSELVINGKATQAEIARAFGVHLVTVKRYVKLYRQGGGRKQCWEEQQEPIVSFCCDDGATCGFPFFHLSIARLTDDLLSLQWPGAVIEIRGPLAGRFFKDFDKQP